MATPDLSNVPEADLHAMAAGNMSQVSEPTLRYLAGQPQQPVSMAPDVSIPSVTGHVLAHDAEDVLGVPEAVGTGVLNIPYDFLSGARDLGNKINALLGMAPAAMPWIDKLRANPTAPTLQAEQDANNSAPGRFVNTEADQRVIQPVERFAAAHPAVEQAGEVGGDLLKMSSAAGPLVGAAGVGVDAFTAARQAAAQALRQPLRDTPEDIDAALSAVGYRRLPSQDPNAGLPSKLGAKVVGEGPLSQHQTLTDQAVTNALAAHEGGVPVGTLPTRAELVKAAKAGPAKVYESAEASLPPTLTQDPELQGGISSIGDTVSQLPRSPDVEGLKQTMLSQPDMTRRQLFANVQQARQRAALYMASDDPDKNAIGRAYMQLANHYEAFIGRQLEANPNSPVSLADFQNARTAFAKNYAVQAGLHGPDANTIDAARIARQAAQNPGELTGGLRLIAAQHARYPLSTNYGPTTLAEGGIGRSGDLPGMLGRQIGGGALAAGLARMFHLPEEVGFGAGMLSTSIAMNRLRRILAGSPEDAAEIAARAHADPRLASFFVSDRDAALPAGFNRSPPTIRGLLPSPAMVNAGGGATTSTTLAQDLGLSPDVQAAGPLHPGAARVPAPQRSVFDDLVEGREPEALETPPGGLQRRAPGPRSSELFPTAGLSLSPEEAAETAQRFPGSDASYADLLTAMAPEEGGEPLIARGKNGPVALNAQRRIGGPEGVANPSSRALANNASGESAASLEAINRGSKNIVEVNPEGTGSVVMRGVDQVDRNPAPGHIFVDADTGKLLNSGTLPQRLAQGLLARYHALRTLGPALQGPEPDIPF